MTLVLLAEDDKDLTKIYKTSLENSGFKVLHTDDGEGLYYSATSRLIETPPKIRLVDIIVSDTELYGIDGDVACKYILSAKDMAQGLLIIGMSLVRDNDEYWKGIAHEFLYKGSITDLGKAVRALYNRFQNGQILVRYKEF